MARTKSQKRNPKWGYDPWKGPGTPPVKNKAGVWVPEVALGDLVTAKIFSGADTIGEDLSLLPPGLDLYGSYVDGFGGFEELQTLHPEAFLLSYTVDNSPALCFDCEPKAMVLAQLGPWYDTLAWRDAEGLSWGYTNAGNMQACIDAMGDRKWIRVSAHFGHGPHICGPSTCGFPQAHWTQWDDHGAEGQNIDRLIGTYLPSVKPKKNPHYDRYDKKRRAIYGFRSELDRVKEYDEKRALQTPTHHPDRARLAVLRDYMRLGAARLRVLGNPEKYHRKFRREEMHDRAKGGRVI